MLHTKFQANEPSGSEEEDFCIVFFHFLWFKPRNTWEGAILDSGGHHLNRIGKGPLGNTTYQISSYQPGVVLEKTILQYISFLNSIPSAAGPFWTTVPHFVQVYQEMLHTKFQGPMPSGFREDTISANC